MKHFYVCVMGMLFMLVSPMFGASDDPLEGSCGRQANYNMDSTNLMWKVDTQKRTLTITGKGRMRDYDNDTKAPWYPWRMYIQKAIFPNGMTTVGSIAMWDLSALTEVEWNGNTVEVIYKSGFASCTALEHIALPTSLKTISNNAFYNCTALKDITIPNSVTSLGENAFNNCTALQQVTLPNSLSTIPSQAFRNCKSLKSVTIPNPVTQIEQRAFYNCSSLAQLTLSNSVTSINRGAFKYCSGLSTITWSESLRSIGDSAFYSCTSLKQLSFPASLKQISTRAFHECSNIETVDFGNSPCLIDNEAFYPASSLTTLKSKRIKSIGSSAFATCPKLVNLQLGDSLIRIYDGAFTGCTSLPAIHFPSTIESFLPTCFLYCYALDKITVDPKNPKYDSRNNCNAVIRTADSTLVFGCVKTVIPKETKVIGSDAFCYCIRLKTISIPEGVKTISSSAFIGCTNLASLTLPSTLRVIEAQAFCDCDSLKSVVLPEGLETIGNEAFYSCDKLSSINLPNSVTSIDCAVFNGNNALKSPIYNTTYFVFLPRDYKGKFKIPGTPQKIACQAFENHDGLTEVVIPSSVTSVNKYSFQYCDSLQKADLPSGLTYLGTSAFRQCLSLASTVVPDGVTQIYDSTYYGCSALESAVLSKGLTRVGQFAFTRCKSLLSIIIPDAVTSIGQSAFSGCSSLTSISFPAEMVSFGARMLYNCNKLQNIIWNVRTCKNFNATYRPEDYDPFYGIRGQITDFTFGDSVQIIPDQLCYGMSNLSSISLGSSITSIGASAFAGCTGIKSIHWNLRTYYDPQMYYNSLFYNLRRNITSFTFGDSVQHIPAYLCYEMSSLRKLRFPANLRTIGNFAFRYISELDSISVDEDNDYFDSRNDCNALIDSESDELLLGCYNTRFPDDITGIGEWAFRNVRKLRSVELPESVTFVGPEAFNGCKDLKQLTLSEHIETIDDYAFQDCDSLTRVSLPTDLKQVGLRAFAHCTQLEAIEVNATTPPTIDATSFSETTCPFYVPCGTIDTYRKSPVWSDFGTRLTGLSPFTITIVQNDYSYGQAYIVQPPDCEHNAIVEAQPERGFAFVAWLDEYGNVLSTSKRYEFPIDGDVTLMAVFERAQGLEELLQDNAAVWFDIMGHRVSQPTSGVYVVQKGAETYKVVIP